MFKVILEWDKCDTKEKGKLEQEVNYEVFKEVVNVLTKFVGISISWPKKGGGGT